MFHPKTANNNSIAAAARASDIFDLFDSAYREPPGRVHRSRHVSTKSAPPQVAAIPQDKSQHCTTQTNLSHAARPQDTLIFWPAAHASKAVTIGTPFVLVQFLIFPILSRISYARDGSPSPQETKAGCNKVPSLVRDRCPQWHQSSSSRIAQVYPLRDVLLITTTKKSSSHNTFCKGNTTLKNWRPERWDDDGLSHMTCAVPKGRARKETAPQLRKLLHTMSGKLRRCVTTAPEAHLLVGAQGTCQRVGTQISYSVR